MTTRHLKAAWKSLAFGGVALAAGLLGGQQAAADQHGGGSGTAGQYLGKTKPGLDVLIENDFDVLQGKNVGLITNHTAFTRDNVSIIDALYEAEGVNLVRLFGPEHGIRGTADERVDDSVDERTGLPITSLYGPNRRPTAETLEGIDTLVFDMQDIGTRFYTYIGTMAFCMESAAEHGREFVVLDRPNPIGGHKVEGAVIEEEKTGRSTSIRAIPTRHGMTVGELALMFNEEWGGIGVDLTVVPVENWTREMYFDQTGLLWKDPSPNMKTMNGAILYPGAGMGETTMLSTGRGLDRPFEMYGGPYMDGAAVAANLANRNTPGVRFIPTTFVPTAPYHRYRHEECGGVFAVIYDREALDSMLAGLHMIQAMYETHPEEYTPTDGFRFHTGDDDTWDMITGGMAPEDILEVWQPGIDAFLEQREPYLLY